MNDKRIRQMVLLVLGVILILGVLSIVSTLFQMIVPLAILAVGVIAFYKIVLQGRDKPAAMEDEIAESSGATEEVARESADGEDRFRLAKWPRKSGSAPWIRRKANTLTRLRLRKRFLIRSRRVGSACKAMTDPATGTTTLKAYIEWGSVEYRRCASYRLSAAGLRCLKPRTFAHPCKPFYGKLCPVRINNRKQQQSLAQVRISQKAFFVTKTTQKFPSPLSRLPAESPASKQIQGFRAIP